MDIYQYTDYQTFLKDYYNEQKSCSQSFSYRVFARQARLMSPNYLKLVIDGKRKVTPKNLSQFIRGLGLKKNEAEFFKTLVSYKESKDIDQKKEVLNLLLKIKARANSVAHEVKDDDSEIMKQWYHWVIREMVMLSDFNPDPHWIAERLRHQITPEQAAEGVALLKAAGLLEETENGLVAKQALITTGDEVKSTMVQQLHKQFSDQAMYSLFNDSVQDREFGALTLAFSCDQLPELKRIIKEFRRELNTTFSKATGNDEVYHFVIQFFPVTKKVGGL